MLYEARRSMKPGEENEKRLEEIFRHLNDKKLFTRKGQGLIKRGVLLSGGELQTVCLSRVFWWDPEVLVLDEPFNNLDSQAREGLLSLILDKDSPRRPTRILILHDLYLALAVCDYIIFMNRGRIWFAGATRELLDYLKTEKDKTTLPDQVLKYLEKIDANLSRAAEWLF